MAKKQKQQKLKGGNKKHGRSKRKAANKANPISLFVRGKISAAEYWKVTNIKTPAKGRV